jgi:hypothetical protein
MQQSDDTIDEYSNDVNVIDFLACEDSILRLSFDRDKAEGSILSWKYLKDLSEIVSYKQYYTRPVVLDTPCSDNVPVTMINEVSLRRKLDQWTIINIYVYKTLVVLIELCLFELIWLYID